MTEEEKILPPQTAYRRRLSEMLDLTYELEGLLHIGVSRSEVPQRLNQLIVSKLNAIIAIADNPATPEELAREDQAYSLEEEDPEFIPQPLFKDEEDVKEPTEEHEVQPAVHQERGRLFSINDRFLYARELFGGELSNFDRAMNDVITLDSYDEAEEYFISEWGFDPDSPTAIKFLGTISHLF